MVVQKKKKPRGAEQPSVIARQIRIVFYTVFICITVVLLAVTLDLIINPNKTWTDSLAIRWISERRERFPFFK
jgi:hypothetical protein